MGRPAENWNDNRGARIRTGDLADPNGARYQAAPRPEEDFSMPSAPSGVRSARARHGLEVPHREPRDQGLEGRLELGALGLRPARQPGALDRLALGDDVVDQLRMAVAEVRADGVQ